MKIVAYILHYLRALIFVYASTVIVVAMYFQISKYLRLIILILKFSSMFLYGQL